MSEDIAALRRKRGTIRASITRIKTRLRALESKEDKSDFPNHAHQMTQRLDTLSSNFKDVHYSIISQTKSEEDLAREQAMLDETNSDAFFSESSHARLRRLFFYLFIF
jgi:phytoene dehydrogenase-like protein